MSDVLRLFWHGWFFCLLTIQSVHAKEPYYNGIPLSDWIFDDSGHTEGATDAIQQMGTNAIPTLLDLLGTTPKTIKWEAARLGSKTMREHLIGDDDGVVFGQIKESVVSAFIILGTNAESAVPKMVKLLNKDNDEISLYAAAALAAVGPKGFAALTNALTISNPSIRLDISTGLGANGGDSKSVTQIFIYLLKDKSPDVRRSAAGNLGGRDPDLSIPALMPMLDDPDLTVRQEAASALSNYGSKAKSAAPKILSLYTNSPNQGVFEALKEIDLETATEAEAMVVNSGPLNSKRQDYTKTELKNGLELIVGGYIHTELPSVTNRYLASSELYDPKTGKWTETGEMTTTRHGHAAVLLTNGKVFVVGGESGKNNGTLSSAEIFDPETGIWTVTTPMHSTHYGCKASLNPDGTVLIFVAPFNSPIVKCEQYDAASGNWTTITN